MPAAYIVEGKAPAHKLNYPFAADFPKQGSHLVVGLRIISRSPRSIALVPVRIPVGPYQGNIHRGYSASFPDKIDTFFSRSLVEFTEFAFGFRIVEHHLGYSENRLVAGLVNLVQPLLPGGVVFPEVISCQTAHIVVRLAVFRDVRGGMLHRVGVVMPRNSFAPQRLLATSVIAFCIWTEIINVFAEFDRVLFRDYEIALVVQPLSTFPEGPLREGRDIVRSIERGNFCLNRRLEADGETRIPVFKHVPQILAFTSLVT